MLGSMFNGIIFICKNSLISIFCMPCHANVVNKYCMTKHAFVVSLPHTYIIMVKDLDPKVKELLEKIGAQVRIMRKESSSLDYKKYAKEELPIGIATYWRIEKGENDYHISNLLQVLLNYPDKKLSDFFKEAGL